MAIWDSMDVQILKNNAPFMNKYELEQLFNGKYSAYDIKVKCSNSKIKYKKINNFKIDDNYFKTWSYDMSYILGLFCTDGSITKKNRAESYEIRLGLQNQDSYIIELINNKLNSNYKIVERENLKIFQCYSKTIAYDLMKLLDLIDPSTKTFDLLFPDIPDEYLPSFLRGIFDGDGCINYHQSNKMYRSTLTTASKEFGQQFIDKVRYLDSSINGSLTFHKNNYNGVYHVTFYKHDTIKFGKIIYSTPPGDLFIKRKFDKFKQAVENM